MEDSVSGRFSFENGALGTILASDATPSPWSYEMTTRRISIIFTPTRTAASSRHSGFLGLSATGVVALCQRRPIGLQTPPAASVHRAIEGENIFQRGVGLNVVAGGQNVPAACANLVHEPIDFHFDLVVRRPLQPALCIDLAVQSNLTGKLAL